MWKPSRRSISHKRLAREVHEVHLHVPRPAAPEHLREQRVDVHRRERRTRRRGAAPCGSRGRRGPGPAGARSRPRGVSRRSRPPASGAFDGAAVHRAQSGAGDPPSAQAELAAVTWNPACSAIVKERADAATSSRYPGGRRTRRTWLEALRERLDATLLLLQVPGVSSTAAWSCPAPTGGAGAGSCRRASQDRHSTIRGRALAVRAPKSRCSAAAARGRRRRAGPLRTGRGSHRRRRAGTRRRRRPAARRAPWYAMRLPSSAPGHDVPPNGRARRMGSSGP